MFRHDIQVSGYVSGLSSTTKCDLLWSYRTGTGVVDNHPFSLNVGLNGQLNVSGYADGFYAIDSDGSFRWSYKIAYTDYVVSYNDGKIGVGGFLMLNSNATLVWSYVGFRSPTGYDASGMILGLLTQGCGILNSNGTLVWSYGSHTEENMPPAMDTAGNVYMAAGTENDPTYPRLFALDSQGAFRWSYLGYDWVNDASIIQNDKILFSCGDSITEYMDH
jgi:hypothetical protein